jgi:hypothetical protein
VQYIQGKSKPNPNWAKLSQIQQNPAKDNQGKSLDFLVRIEPYQGLARTPPAVFSFARPVRAHRLARVGPPRRPGALLFFLFASFNCARSAASPFSEGIVTQISKICKEMAINRQNARNSGRLERGRSSAASSSDRRLEQWAGGPPTANSGRRALFLVTPISL